MKRSSEVIRENPKSLKVVKWLKSMVSKKTSYKDQSQQYKSGREI